MTRDGVPDGDMPISLQPDRGDVPQLGDAAFDALLARTLRPEEAVPSLRPLVERFAALYAAPVASAPAAEAAAITQFRAVAAAGHGAVAHGPGRHQLRRSRAGRWARPRLVSIRLGAAAAAVALTAGGAAAAYAGDLPAPVQRLAHAVIGAPPATRGTPRPEPGRAVTPPIPANAAYGLCQAYEQALARNDPELNPVTLRRLASLAGGTSQVKAYCARVVRPGSPASGHPAHPQHGQPSVLPTPVLPTPHTNPTPAASHHGKPSALPTPAATHHGKPTS